jgi:hypothetical protein
VSLLALLSFSPEISILFFIFFFLFVCVIIFNLQLFILHMHMQAILSFVSSWTQAGGIESYAAATGTSKQAFFTDSAPKSLYKNYVKSVITRCAIPYLSILSNAHPASFFHPVGALMKPNPSSPQAQYYHRQAICQGQHDHGLQLDQRAGVPKLRPRDGGQMGG